MTQSFLESAAPDGYSNVTPWIVSKDSARLIAFMTAAFGAKEKEGSRMLGSDGSIAHVEVDVGDATVMLFDARPSWPETPAFLRLYVTDADAAFQRAIEAGARPVTRVTELGWGDRVGRVADPSGNIWWLQAPTASPPADIEARMRQPAMVQAMKYVQESLDEELERRNAERVTPEPRE